MNEAGAAVVAAQLIAFYNEPVRYRPRLTHGREAFPGGLAAMRFAQGRFPHNLLRDLPPADRERLREAADFFIRQVCLWDGATHYQLLCVPPDARRDAIKEHYHALMALLHPDRQESTAQHWPAGAAQRVNDAYAVLSNDQRRREYDETLRRAASGPARLDEVAHSPETAAVHTPFRPRSAAKRARYRRPVLVVCAVVASLFFFHVWFAGEISPQYAALQAATPFDLSSRWVRDAFTTEGPRFLTAGETRRPAPPSAAESVIAPLLRALGRGSASAEAPRLAEAPVLKVGNAGATARAPEAPAAGPAPTPPVPAQRPAELAQAAPKAQPAAKAPAAAAAAENAPAAAGIDTAEVEMLMARVITYYEAGDLDRFLALQDAQSIGVWEALRLRHDFQDFFRSTRARRLRLNKVTLDTSGPVARARGEALLSGEYVDEPGRFERVVRLELEAVARGGELRISRLLLFPHGS